MDRSLDLVVKASEISSPLCWPFAPFCNSLPIRRAPERLGEGAPLDVAYIDGPALTVARSRQRYDRQGPHQLRYVDLGLSRGFEADLVVDEDGLIVSYEHLFERVAPPA